MRKILFDARELEHPQPLEESVRRLSQLGEEEYLYMLHRKQPLPLLQMAQQHGFRTHAHEDAKGVWHIVITKMESVNLKDLIHV